jgi:hypothetical protein
MHERFEGIFKQKLLLCDGITKGASFSCIAFTKFNIWCFSIAKPYINSWQHSNARPNNKPKPFSYFVSCFNAPTNCACFCSDA